jgi:prolyl-tRNA editing enzyme YbaK/EbsC (Cys-tRNA(Pro) deacylase)
MFRVDIHLKQNVVSVLPQHTLERRIAALQRRFDSLEALASQAAARPVVVVAPQAQPSNPEWERQDSDTDEVANLRELTKRLGFTSSKFQWVPTDYYDHPLSWRQQVLKALTVSHLCKAVVLENTHCTNNDCSDPRNSRYYTVVLQYVRRFDSDKVMRFIRGLNEGIGKKNFNFRLAAKGDELTGFSHNAVVPFGTRTKIPIILDQEILQLNPRHFWMGGGHVDCKLRIDTDEFVALLNPLVGDVTTSLTKEELNEIL